MGRVADSTFDVRSRSTNEPLSGRITRMTVLAFTHRSSVRLAEVGFLLVLFAGVWLAAAQIPAFRLGPARGFVAGAALAIGGLLLIIATHWGHFG
jgi:hypothetical protein